MPKFIRLTLLAIFTVLSIEARAASALPASPIAVLPLPFSVVTFVDADHLVYLSFFVRVTYGVYEIKTATVVYEKTFPGRYFHGLTLSPDKTLLATLVDGRGIFVWEAKTGPIMAELPFPALAGDVAFSPDGRLLFSTDLLGRKLSVWSTEDWKALFTILLPHSPDAISVSPDGSYIATGAFETAMVVNTSHWQVEKVRSFASQVSVFAFSPRDPTLFVGMRDGTIAVWDLFTDTVDFLPVKHGGEVMCFALSPDRRFLASGGADATVILWDWSSRTPLYKLDLWQELGLEELIPEEEKPFARFAARVYSVAFSPDGKLLATSGVDLPGRGSVQIWSLEDVLREAKNAGE